MDSTPSLLDVNRRIEELCDAVETGDPAALSGLCSAWRDHERLDWTALYPRVPTDRSDADVLAARALADHRLVDRLISQITADGAGAAVKAGLLARLIREHVVGEQSRVLPVLDGQEATPVDDSDVLPAPCSMGIHDWVTKHNVEGDDYVLCVRCGRRAE